MSSVSMEVLVWVATKSATDEYGGVYAERDGYDAREFSYGVE